jgi:iron-sulfur cluster repair protein YtfE (RIC family)
MGECRVLLRIFRTMDNITTYLSADHKRCDELFAEAESSVTERDWAAADNIFAMFREAIEQHFVMEERVLFPAFEQQTGHTSGPTAVMRTDHAHMRELLADMARALEYRQQDDYLGHSDTLNIMIQQHNMKEEGILYPMTDNMLRDSRVEILDAMQTFNTTV